MNKKEVHVCYINFDGFARYYFDELMKQANDSYLPNLKKLMIEGVFFENLYNALPSITNPCQNMILSGSTSAVTKNVYRYYDKTKNVVVQQYRENANKTLIDIALENGLTVASVAHYLTESRLSLNDSKKIYLYADETGDKVLQRGVSKANDYFSRFEQLNKIIKKEKIISKNNEIVITDLPNLLILYADDLDAVGHNEKDARGYTKAISEKGRMNNILTLLKEMDEKLGEFIDVCKEQGVYDKITFFITTDHGMTPFGYESSDDIGDYGISKLPDLSNCLALYDKDLRLELVSPNESPKADTTVVGVGMNLNLQLTFSNKKTELQLKEIKECLLKEKYIANVFTRKELIKTDYCINDTDMIITPSHHYFFSKNTGVPYYVRGQHDSTLPSSKHIFGLIFGQGIKRDYNYQAIAYNYDFGTTMAYCLGLVIPDANGKILPIFKKGHK